MPLLVFNFGSHDFHKFQFIYLLKFEFVPFINEEYCRVPEGVPRLAQLILGINPPRLTVNRYSGRVQSNRTQLLFHSWRDPRSCEVLLAETKEKELLLIQGRVGGLLQKKKRRKKRRPLPQFECSCSATKLHSCKVNLLRNKKMEGLNNQLLGKSLSPQSVSLSPDLTPPLPQCSGSDLAQ